MAHAIVCPLSLTLAQVLLHLLSAKLVVDEAAKSDGVAEHLKARDGISEDEHRGAYEEDVFEDAAEGHDEGGGSADLQALVSLEVLEVVVLGLALTRKTTDTFRRNATTAFASKTKYPTF